MKFVPKRDLWLSIVVWSCVIVLVLAGISPLFTDDVGWVGGTILFIVLMLFACFFTWLWVATYYVLEDSGLLVRSGPIVQRIPYDDITHIKPIRSWMASAATSSSRLEIRYGKYGNIHISPLDRQTFVEEMEKRCPHMSVEVV